MSPNGMAWPRPAPNLLGRGWGGVMETIATIAIDLDKYTFRLVG